MTPKYPTLVAPRVLVDVHRAQLRPPRRHQILEVAVAEQVVQCPTVRRVHLSGAVLAQVALEDGDLLRHAGLGGAPKAPGGPRRRGLAGL